MFGNETNNIPASNAKVYKVQLLHVVKHNQHFPWDKAIIIVVGYGDKSYFFLLHYYPDFRSDESHYMTKTQIGYGRRLRLVLLVSHWPETSSENSQMIFLH